MFISTKEVKFSFLAVSRNKRFSFIQTGVRPSTRNAAQYKRKIMAFRVRNIGFESGSVYHTAF